MRIFETGLRVRYQETDSMGIVYYANYLVWFEVVRSEFLRSIGFSYRALEEDGLRFMVVDASCRYKSPCRYDDPVKVRARVGAVKNTSMSFEYEVESNGVLCATGKTTHVFTNSSFKPVRIPEKLREAFT